MNTSSFPTVVARVQAFSLLLYFAISLVGTVKVRGIALLTEVSILTAMWADVYLTLASSAMMFGMVDPSVGEVRFGLV